MPSEAGGKPKENQRENQRTLTGTGRLVRRLGQTNSGFVNFDQAEAEYSANLGRLDVKKSLENARKLQLAARSAQNGCAADVQKFMNQR